MKWALATSSARAAAKDPALADLARREQDALAQIGALNGLLSNALSLPAGEQNPAAVQDLRSRIESLRSARDAIMKEIDARGPDYANLVVRLGFDPIWFGVIIVLVAEIGVITPPVGVNVYVIKGIAPEVPLETIFKGIFPFLLAIIINTGILMAFPKIALILPALIK